MEKTRKRRNHFRFKGRPLRLLFTERGLIILSRILFRIRIFRTLITSILNFYKSYEVIPVSRVLTLSTFYDHD